jgi:hypothetical protein
MTLHPPMFTFCWWFEKNFGRDNQIEAGFGAIQFSV